MMRFMIEPASLMLFGSLKDRGWKLMTDDRLFNERDLEQEVTDLKNEIKFLRSFLVEKNLAEEYILWKLEVDD